MDRTEVRHIINATLRGGSKTPGPFDMLKVMVIKLELEACASTSQVVEILARNRGLITRSFGVSAAAFDAGVERIKALGGSV